MAALAYAWGPPVVRGTMRAAPEDFAVEEILGFEPGGGGEHAWLWIRKRDATTAEVGAALARFAGVARSAVGWAGRKDRHAVTAQWFSVQLPGAADPDWAAFEEPRWGVEAAVRHPRKLRVGTHRGNRFRLRVRGLEGETGRIDERARRIAASGFPNYFGAQRFGDRGRNLHRAREQLAAGRRRRPDGMLLSAARAWLFNRVLDRRVADSTWCTAAPGDALMLAGTRSVFECRGDEPDLEERIASFDVDVTGPLWGIGSQPVGVDVACREAEWLADEAALRRALEGHRVAAGRRPLRARAPDLQWRRDGDGLELAFTLDSGVFATSLVRELIDAGADTCLELAARA